MAIIAIRLEDSEDGHVLMSVATDAPIVSGHAGPLTPAQVAALDFMQAVVEKHPVQPNTGLAQLLAGVNG